MSFYDHLDELRERLVRCAWVFTLGFGFCFWKVEYPLQFLRAPLFEVLPEGKRELYFTSLFEGFFVHLKIAGYSSLLLLSPFFFYQLWAFIAPGLYPKERKLVVPFVSAASVFFIGGAAFAYYVLFPVGFKYFVTFGGPTDVPMLTMDSYYGTALKLMFLFGLAFEMPVLISFLGFLGVVNAEGLRKNRKPAVLAITVMSALFAPPDAMSMLLLMAPLILLYECAIVVVAVFGRRRAAREAAEGGGGNAGGSGGKDSEPPNPLVGRSTP